MSLHNKPNYQIPELVESLKAHGLDADEPSQLSDALRTGWVAARAALAAQPGAVGESWGVDANKLLPQTMKPSEIAGPADAQRRRVGELLSWFVRLADGQANPKGTAEHAFELAYYIASAPTEPMSAPTAEPDEWAAKIMELAHRWAQATYCKGQGRPFEDFDAIQIEMCSLLATPPSAANPEPSDAERYQLVRRGQHWSVIDGIGNVLRGDDLDAAIDSIRATKGGKL